MSKRSEHIYAVGWTGSTKRGAYVYGIDDTDGKSRWIDLMTMNQARVKMSTLTPAKRHKRAIFQLVPVETIR